MIENTKPDNCNINPMSIIKKNLLAFLSFLEFSLLNFSKVESIDFFRKSILSSELYEPIDISPPIFRFGNSLNGPTFNRNIFTTPNISSPRPTKLSINPNKSIN